MSSPVAAVIEVAARALVDAPDAVSVTETSQRGATLVELTVAAADVGKVIGRQGRTADALRTLLAIRPEAEFTWMTFSYPARDAAHLILKGAIAVDGISLTIATLGDDRFDVQIIPFTWEHTNLAGLAVGDSVNLEYDVLGKYAVRAALLAARQTSSSLP